MATTVKIVAMTINGHPYGCPECGGASFTLDGRGLFDNFPAWGNCPSSHAWEDPLITLGVLKEIDAARTGRQRPEDDDTFQITVGGAILAGILHPELTPEDLKQLGRIYWRRLVKPALRRQRRKAGRAVTRPVGNAVAAAKAAALEAAWTAQAGGHSPDPDYRPEPVNPCPACQGRGHHKIESRIHAATRVDCTVCVGTGEID